MGSRPATQTGSGREGGSERPASKAGGGTRPASKAGGGTSRPGSSSSSGPGTNPGKASGGAGTLKAVKGVAHTAESVQKSVGFQTK
jgi:hypothetical protein